MWFGSERVSEKQKYTYISTHTHRTTTTTTITNDVHTCSVAALPLPIVTDPVTPKLEAPVARLTAPEAPSPAAEAMVIRPLWVGGWGGGREGREWGRERGGKGEWVGKERNLSVKQKTKCTVCHTQ